MAVRYLGGFRKQIRTHRADRRLQSHARSVFVGRGQGAVVFFEKQAEVFSEMTGSHAGKNAAAAVGEVEKMALHLHSVELRGAEGVVGGQFLADQGICIERTESRECADTHFRRVALGGLPLVGRKVAGRFRAVDDGLVILGADPPCVPAFRADAGQIRAGDLLGLARCEVFSQTSISDQHHGVGVVPATERVRRIHVGFTARGHGKQPPAEHSIALRRVGFADRERAFSRRRVFGVQPVSPRIIAGKPARLRDAVGCFGLRVLVENRGLRADPHVRPHFLLQFPDGDHHREPRVRTSLGLGVALRRGTQRDGGEAQQTHRQQGEQHHQGKGRHQRESFFRIPDQAERGGEGMLRRIHQESGFGGSTNSSTARYVILPLTGST